MPSSDEGRGDEAAHQCEPLRGRQLVRQGQARCRGRAGRPSASPPPPRRSRGRARSRIHAGRAGRREDLGMRHARRGGGSRTRGRCARPRSARRRDTRRPPSPSSPPSGARCQRRGDRSPRAKRIEVQGPRSCSWVSGGETPASRVQRPEPLPHTSPLRRISAPFGHPPCPPLRGLYHF